MRERMMELLCEKGRATEMDIITAIKGDEVVVSYQERTLILNQLYELKRMLISQCLWTIDRNQKTLTFSLVKVNRYATSEAGKMVGSKHAPASERTLEIWRGEGKIAREQLFLSLTRIALAYLATRGQHQQLPRNLMNLVERNMPSGLNANLGLLVRNNPRVSRESLTEEELEVFAKKVLDSMISLIERLSKTQYPKTAREGQIMQTLKQLMQGPQPKSTEEIVAWLKEQFPLDQP